MTGDLFAEEPWCVYQPKRQVSKKEEPLPAAVWRQQRVWAT